MVDPVIAPVAPMLTGTMAEMAESAPVTAADVQRFDRAMQVNASDLPPILNIEETGRSTPIADESVVFDSLIDRRRDNARMSERVVEAFDRISRDYNEWTSYVTEMRAGGDAAHGDNHTNAIGGGPPIGVGASGIVTDPSQQIDAQIYRPDPGESSPGEVARDSLETLEAMQMRMLNETRAMSAEANQFTILTAKLNMATAGLSKMLGSFATLMKNQ